MERSPLTAHEDARLAALARYQILDSPGEDEYTDITRLAATLCGTPIALISLVDRDRQWFKAGVGVGLRETPLDVSFCIHTIGQSGLFVVPDAAEDARFADNPLVAGETRLRFYAGTPLETPDGFALGTLCVLDHAPRDLSDSQRESLAALGRQVMKLMELRRVGREVVALNERLQRTMVESNHRIKNNLQLIAALIEIRTGADDATAATDAVLKPLSQQVRTIGALHDLLTDRARTDGAPSHVSARDALQKLLPVLQGTIQAGQRLHLEVADFPLTIRQASALSLLVNELVSNAVKHGGTGDVDVSLTTDGDTARLEVRDSGAGFPADFDPQTASNTGLELIETICRYDLRGDVTFQNRPAPGRGAVVAATFPRSDSEIAPSDGI